MIACLFIILLHELQFCFYFDQYAWLLVVCIHVHFFGIILLFLDIFFFQDWFVRHRKQVTCTRCSLEKIYKFSKWLISWCEDRSCNLISFFILFYKLAGLYLSSMECNFYCLVWIIDIIYVCALSWDCSKQWYCFTLSLFEACIRCAL